MLQSALPDRRSKGGYSSARNARADSSRNSSRSVRLASTILYDMLIALAMQIVSGRLSRKYVLTNSLDSLRYSFSLNLQCKRHSAMNHPYLDASPSVILAMRSEARYIDRSPRHRLQRDHPNESYKSPPGDYKATFFLAAAVVLFPSYLWLPLTLWSKVQSSTRSRLLTGLEPF